MTDKEAKAFYNSSAWKCKRMQILDRDHYECQDCRRRIKAAAASGTQLIGSDRKIWRAEEVHHIQELKEHPELDLVLLDVFLPGMNGLELLRRLRATQQTSEVIIISAARDSAQICEALRLGCVDYIIKPFSPDRLHLALEKYRQRSLLMRKSFLEQGEVDRLAATKDDSETEQIAEYPKGIEQKTLECICENLPKDGTAFNGRDQG